MESQRTCGYAYEDLFEEGRQVINYIRETILFGLEDDFWREDSLLVDGVHDCYGGQLNCEGMSAWPDMKDGVLHLSLGKDAGKQFKITIKEENNNG